MAEKSDAEKREELRRLGEQHSDRARTEKTEREERARKEGEGK